MLFFWEFLFSRSSMQFRTPSKQDFLPENEYKDEKLVQNGFLHHQEETGNTLHFLKTPVKTKHPTHLQSMIIARIMLLIIAENIYNFAY